DKSFEGKLNPTFAKKALMANMVAKDTKAFENGDSESLQIGAITHADAIVLASENTDDAVLKFVKDSNKPVLAYNLTDDFENFYNFYEEISNDELVSIA
ncbi:MAG: starch synthase, partial [Pedobacter sp.]|nr:starch synthase [Pedobacter sp.]